MDPQWITAKWLKKCLCYITILCIEKELSWKSKTQVLLLPLPSNIHLNFGGKSFVQVVLLLKLEVWLRWFRRLPSAPIVYNCICHNKKQKGKKFFRRKCFKTKLRERKNNFYTVWRVKAHMEKSRKTSWGRWHWIECRSILGIRPIPRRSEQSKKTEHRACFEEQHVILFGWSSAMFYENQSNRNLLEVSENHQKVINANGSGTLQCKILRNGSKVIPRYWV